LEGRIVGLFLIALIGGLAGGFGLSYISYQPQVQNLQNTTNNLQNQVTILNSTLQGLLNTSGAGANNQVQVTGTVQETQTNSIVFLNAETIGNSSAPRITTSSLIVNGQYSVILLGGHSYLVTLFDSYESQLASYTIYVPLGVTTFTANF